MAKRRARGKKKKSTQSTPSADEIIEALAVEMGVDEDDAPSNKDKDAAKDEPEHDEDVDVEDEDLDDDEYDDDEDLDDDEEYDDEDEYEDDEEEEEEEEVKPKAVAKSKPSKKAAKAKASTPKAKPAPELTPYEMNMVGVEEVFNIRGNQTADVDYDSIKLDDDEDDFNPAKKGNYAMFGIVLALVLVIGAILAVPRMDDISQVFAGTYRDNKDQKIKREEEEWRKKQMEALERYGNISITGTPNHAFIGLQMGTDPQPQQIYAKLSSDPTTWTELRTPQVINNLKIRQNIVLKISAPNHTPKTQTLIETMWQDTSGAGPMGTYTFEAPVYLDKTSAEVTNELRDRMDSMAELEAEDLPAGLINVTSTPPGAKVMINKQPLLDKEGKPVVTPATISMIPPSAKAIAAAEKDEKLKKPEPQPLNINTPPDQGYRVDVYFDDPNMPKYATWIYRDLWTCKKKDEKALKKLKEDARPILSCNYEYDVKPDFAVIKAAVERDKKTQADMKKQKEEIDRINKAAAERKAAAAAQ